MDEKNEILALLPEKLPHEEVMRYAGEAMHNDALGGCEFLEFHRESAVDDFDLGWPLGDEPRRRPAWAAQCTCGVCGETWQSGWIDRERFLVYAGDDGQVYPGVPDGEGADPVISYGVDERLFCPMCNARLRIVAKGSLRNGRTYRCMFGRVKILGDHTAVVFWMLERAVDAKAASTYAAYPWMALVIGRDGKVYRFHHTWNGMYGKRMPGEKWTESPHMCEPLRSRYYCYGAINGTMVGGYMDEKVPDQTGKTGEKTGLDAYIAGGGKYPLAYLLRQKRRPYLENLVRAGWAGTVEDALSVEVNENARMFRYLDEIADLRRAKPHEMLGMTREEVRRYGKEQWNTETAALYHAHAWDSVAEFTELLKKYNLAALKGAASMLPLPELRRADRYIEKQRNRNGHAQAPRTLMIMYGDYRRMCAEVGSTDFYPRDLRAAHDRLTGETRALKSMRFDERFAALAGKWAALEWSDGAICALLPRGGGELVREGETLHHCVGGYIETHAGGKIIVFIRHARRPERSWFTLNIDLTGAQWREIQLHGYGNEYAHGKYLRIPREVRDFVDRWEKEVLTPTFAQVKAAEKKAAKKTAKKVKAA